MVSATEEVVACDDSLARYCQDSAAADDEDWGTGNQEVSTMLLMVLHKF